MSVHHENELVVAVKCIEGLHEQLVQVTRERDEAVTGIMHRNCHIYLAKACAERDKRLAEWQQLCDQVQAELRSVGIDDSTLDSGVHSLVLQKQELERQNAHLRRQVCCACDHGAPMINETQHEGARGEPVLCQAVSREDIERECYRHAIECIVKSNQFGEACDMIRALIPPRNE